MVSSVKITALPQATTVERDTLPTVPDGSMIFNTTISEFQVTKDGGTNWYEILDSSNPISLQDAYNGGNEIQLDPSVNFLINNSLGDPAFEVIEAGSLTATRINRGALIEYDQVSGPFTIFESTALGANGNNLGNIVVIGQASDASQKTLDVMNVKIEDSNTASFSTSTRLSVLESNSPIEHLNLDGSASMVKVGAANGISLVDNAKLQVEGSSTLFFITNDSQSTGDNIGIFAGENVVYKPVNMQDGVGMVFPFGNNSIGSTITGRLDYLYANNVNVDTATVSTLVGTDSVKDLVSVALTGDVTTSGLASTLATVATGATVGSATNIPQFTYNDKGLVTSATEIAIDTSGVNLQAAYNNSLPTPTITQNNANPIKINGAAGTGGFQFSTATDNALFIIEGKDGDAQVIEFFKSSLLALSEVARICGNSTTATYFDQTWTATNVTGAAEAVDYNFDCVSGGSLSNIMSFTGATNTLELMNDTSKTLDTAATLSDITLQNAYDTGDGVINANFIKPLELRATDDPTNLTFTRDKLGADGLVLLSLKSNGQTSTGALVSSTAFEKRIATGNNATYSEYASSSAYTQAVLKQWFLYDGRTDVFQMKCDLVSYRNEDLAVIGATLKTITTTGQNSSLFQYTDYFSQGYTTPVVTDGAESGKYVFNAISAGTLVPYIEIDGVGSTVKVPNSTSSVLDEVATIADVTLQKGFDNGDGSIAVATGKAFTIIGEDSSDNASVNLYTPIKLIGDTVSSLLFFGSNDFNNKIKYGEILTKIASPIVGSESAKEIFNVMDSGTLKTYLELNGDTQSVDLFENLNLTTINNIEPSGGVFMQTADGTELTASTTQSSILGTGVGNLTMDPNTLVVSGFKFDVSGTFSAFNNDTLTLRLVSNFGGTPINLATVNVSLESAAGQFFELEADFVIRAAGGAGVAKIMTNMDFTYNRNLGNEFVGQRVVVANNVTFDTTISNTLYLTAQFSSANAGNSIKTLVGTLTRTY